MPNNNINAQGLLSGGLWQYFNPSNLNPLNILFAIGMAFLVGMVINWVYYHNYKGVMFSRTFGMTLVMMTLITTPVVMVIKGSIELAMGMVGALSIVRFRTAVKDPLDIAYLFWALTMGILIGAGQYFMAVLALVSIMLLVMVLSRMSNKGVDSYLLVLHFDDFAERQIEVSLRRLRFQRLKSKTVTRTGVEMTIEVRVDKTNALINDLLSIEGVHDATLVAYQNEAV